MKLRAFAFILAAFAAVIVFGAEPDPTMLPLTRPCSNGTTFIDKGAGQTLVCVNNDWIVQSTRQCTTDPPTGKCSSQNTCITASLATYRCVDRAWARADQEIEIVETAPVDGVTTCSSTKPRYGKDTGATFVCTGGLWENVTGIEMSGPALKLGPDGNTEIREDGVYYTGEAVARPRLDSATAIYIDADSDNSGQAAQEVVYLDPDGIDENTLYPFVPDAGGTCSIGDVLKFTDLSTDGFNCAPILFSDLGNSTNTHNGLVVGNGGSLVPNGTGIIQATSFAASPIQCTNENEFSTGVDQFGNAQCGTPVPLKGNASHIGAMIGSDGGLATTGDATCAAAGYANCRWVFRAVASVLTKGASCATDYEGIDFIAFCY